VIKVLTIICLFSLYSCSSSPASKAVNNSPQKCLGSSNLSEILKISFLITEDEKLLSGSIGAPDKGKLCQGQVYKSKEDSKITIFRVWNSTNPNSKLGKWWAFHKPSGKISNYRSEYEICPEWSPLDKLVSCTLKPGATVVVGTGQSAECSEYLTYPTSDKQQIYINDASLSVENCTLLDGEFSWK